MPENNVCPTPLNVTVYINSMKSTLLGNLGCKQEHEYQGDRCSYGLWADLCFPSHREMYMIHIHIYHILYIHHVSFYVLLYKQESSQLEGGLQMQ